MYLSAIVFLYGCPKEKVSPSVSMTNTELLTSTSWKLYALTETKNGVEKTPKIHQAILYNTILLHLVYMNWLETNLQLVILQKITVKIPMLKCI